MTKKTQTLSRVATAVAVLLTLCLVFVAPVGAEGITVTTFDELKSNLTTGKTVTLGADIKLTDDIGTEESPVTGNILVSSTLTIDLNGKKIYALDNTGNTGTFCFIKISGNQNALTIKDSGDNGGIYLVTNKDAFNSGYRSVVLSVEGANAIIEDGFIIHKGPTSTTTTGKPMCYAVDVLSGSNSAKLTFSNGKLESYYIAVRGFCNSVSDIAEVVVEGGEITGTTAGIWMQQPNNNANNMRVTVTGGSISGSTWAAIGCYVPSTAPETYEVSINGGELSSDTGKTILFDLDTSNIGSVKVTKGTFSDFCALNYLGENAVVTVNLAEDVTIDTPITISKKADVTIVGTGNKKSTITYDGTKSATSGVYAAVEIIGASSTVTLTNLDIKATAGSADRGVNIGAADVTLNINGCDIAGLYAINVRASGDKAKITVAKSNFDGSNIQGFCALNNWGTDCVISFTECTLIGENTYTGDNGFSVIVLNDNNDGHNPTAAVTLTDCTITAKMAEGADIASESVFGIRNSGNTVTVTGAKTVVTYPREDLLVIGEGRIGSDDGPQFSMGASRISIEAGTFNHHVADAYIADNHVCVERDGKHVVEAIAPEISNDVEKFGFDSVKVGYTQPDAQEVTITNMGNVPVTLTAATTSGKYDVTVTPATIGLEGTAKVTIKPNAGLPVGNYADTLTITVEGTDKSLSIPVSFLVYQPSSGGSSNTKPEEPVEPETPVEPENPTEEPEAGEPSVETEVTDGGEVLFEEPVAPETPGADTPSDEPAEPAITGVVLPTGTDSEVTFVPVSEQAAPAGKETQTKKVFEINVPTYEKGKAAVIKFTMTVAELAADGKEAADVALWHYDEETGEWTKLLTTFTIVDGIVYFEAVTFEFSPFAIIYADETPVTPDVPDTPAEPETPASPAPVLAVFAALGAAAVLRRK